MKDYVVVIPAYEPNQQLDIYIARLLFEGVAHVIVIDDGNDAMFDELFKKISSIDGCTVLHHEMNRGKGAGLKTAIRFYLEHFPTLKGIVTADADLQHLAKDVLNVGEHLKQLNEGFVLGSRVYDVKNMPPRSLIGNTVTSRFFQLLFGLYIRDTQTGLRGITTQELPEMLNLFGDHFEYEMNMLIYMVSHNKRIVQVDIDAVYQEVHVSHYGTFKDSIRIVQQLLKGISSRRATKAISDKNSKIEENIQNKKKGEFI